MGYCVNYNHINYDVTPSNKAAMIKKYPSILQDLEDSGFEFNEGYDGSLCVDGWDGDKWRDQEEVLNKVSEFAEDGSGSAWTGEDGEHWEYRVEGGTAKHYNPETEVGLLREVLDELFSKYPEEATRFLDSSSIEVKEAAKNAVGG